MFVTRGVEMSTRGFPAGGGNVAELMDMEAVFAIGFQAVNFGFDSNSFFGLGEGDCAGDVISFGGFEYSDGFGESFVI